MRGEESTSRSGPRSVEVAVLQQPGHAARVGTHVLLAQGWRELSVPLSI